MLYNSHLAGDPFFWHAGPIGILLVHGFTATTAEVRPLACRLRQRGFTVTGPLLPGHGTKPEDLNKVQWRDWVRAGEKSCQRLSRACERVLVGGESTGALVAMYLAAEHPDVTGILAYAPAILLNYSPFHRVILRIAAPLLPPISKPNWSPHPLWQGYGSIPLKGAVQLIKLQKAVTSRLLLLHQPIMIVQGRRDNTVRADAPELIYRSVSSAKKEIHWMNESGHLVILDQELDRVVDLTLRFIDGATS